MGMVSEMFMLLQYRWLKTNISLEISHLSFSVLITFKEKVGNKLMTPVIGYLLYNVTLVRSCNFSVTHFSVSVNGIKVKSKFI